MGRSRCERPTVSVLIRQQLNQNMMDMAEAGAVQQTKQSEPKQTKEEKRRAKAKAMKIQ